MALLIWPRMQRWPTFHHWIVDSQKMKNCMKNLAPFNQYSRFVCTTLFVPRVFYGKLGIWIPNFSTSVYPRSKKPSGVPEHMKVIKTWKFWGMGVYNFGDILCYIFQQGSLFLTTGATKMAVVQTKFCPSYGSRAKLLILRVTIAAQIFHKNLQDVS